MLLALICCAAALGAETPRIFKAGAAEVDISPVKLPVSIVGGFLPKSASKMLDALHARCIVLDDGGTRLAIVVADSCMMPRELLDEAKQRASQKTGIPTDHMLISATHTHSAPAAMGALGNDADADYVKLLTEKLAEVIEQAAANLEPAKIGWASVDDYEHTFCRRWIFRSDRMRNDPFDNLTVHANMHPGYQNSDAIAPAGPVDGEVSVLAVQSPQGRPIALLANYSMHYFASTPISADYFGIFDSKVAKALGGTPVVMMSQGTSGDLWLGDYSQPAKAKADIDEYAGFIVADALAAYRKIQYQDWVPLGMAETTLTLQRRVPDEKRLAWAKETLAKLEDGKLKSIPQVYAREQIYLHEQPQRELKLQVIRISDLAINAIPNEVFAITGLKLKAMSPLGKTFNIELANGAEGYIPPPEQHKLGGYTTWPARTAALEPMAEPKIVEAVLKLAEDVSGKPRKGVVEQQGGYAQRVIADRPLGYWRLGEFSGPVAGDSIPNGPAGRYEDGIVFYLPGPASRAFCGEGIVNRCPHFAGGRLVAPISLGKTYSAEMWFWNGFPPIGRPVAGYMFSRGIEGNKKAIGDHLGIGGTHGAQGKLIFYNGDKLKQMLSGSTSIETRTWHHVLLVRDGKRVRIYLDGQLEISGESEVVDKPDSAGVFFGGRSDNFANWEGKLDEVAIYGRTLSAQDAAEHFQLAGMPGKVPTTGPTVQSGPLSPQQSLTALHVHEGFEVELVVSEPLVMDPVAIAWGPDGKLWVAEMADYPQGMDGKGKAGGRIKYLEDTDGDGKYDKATVVLDEVSFPNGVAPWRDGVLVTAAPEIFFAGIDGKRRTLYTGFPEGNQQLRVNGLRWGLDNWLYCANGLRGRGIARSVQSNQQAILDGHDIRIRPDDGSIEAVTGPTQFGLNRNDAGDWFGCYNSYPLWHNLIPEQYARRNPYVTMPSPQVQLMLPANPQVFPLSQEQKRYHTFGHVGHFTSACSAMIYRDELLFDRSTTHAFVCEPVHNLVHHEVLTESGATFTASRAADEKEREFLASEDGWFRPVMVCTGPDGALWVVDMYRRIIEHPDFLPPAGKQELQTMYRDGSDRGRIYRIYPKGKRPGAVPRLDKLSDPQLVAEMESSNGWHRDMAQEVIVWRKNFGAVAELEKMARSGATPLARLQAMCTLDGLGVLKSEIVRQALADRDRDVRRQALRLSEVPGLRNPELISDVIRLVNDPDAKVRLQLAFTLGQWDAPAAGQALAKLALSAGDDGYLMAAVMSSALKHQRIITEALLSSPQPASVDTLANLFSMASGTNDRDAITRMIALAATPRDGRYSARQMQTAGRLLDIASQHPDAMLSEKMHPVITAARKEAGDKASDEPTRVAAIELLGREKDFAQADLKILTGLLSPTEGVELQKAAVRGIGRVGDERAADRLISGWAGHTPEVRAAIVDLLAGREPWALKLLGAVESGKIAQADLDLPHRTLLLQSSSKNVKQAAQKLLGQSTPDKRQKVVAAFQDVLAMSGDAARGKKVFALNCAGCHQLENVGHEIGPNLRSVSAWPPQALLVAVLDPNRQVDPRYVGFTATLLDGQSIFGIITSESGASITIKGLDGKEKSILRSSIKTLTSTNRSLMPDGFESAISHRQMADLLEYVHQATNR